MPLPICRPNQGRVFNLTCVAILFVLMFASTGCVSLRTQDSTDDATPSPEVTPETETPRSEFEQAILPLHPQDDLATVTGSAVVLTDEGLLLTAQSALGSDVLVALPDGSSHRPVTVSIEPIYGLVLLKIPATGLTPIEFGSSRPVSGSEIFATGFDGSSGTPGRMSGTITSTSEPLDDDPYRARGAVMYETDMQLVSGFLGGAIADETGAFSGIIIEGSGENGQPAINVASQWLISAWLQTRDRRLDVLREASASWDAYELPGNWSVNLPDDWAISVQTDQVDEFRAEATPADPDIPLQLAISVEPNDYGTDGDSFVDEVFGDRSSARIWSIDHAFGRSLVRASMIQEGALVDVAYLLDEDFLIALSLTSGYRPETDSEQVDQARALFDVVIGSIERTE
jgi:hypothetical protein